MKVHLFGACSSPSCATFGLRHIATQCAASLPEGKSFITDNFYVDDGLISVPDTESGLDIYHQSTQICKTANIHLHKFLSNDSKLMKEIPETERAQCAVNLDLPQGQESRPVERALLASNGQ